MSQWNIVYNAVHFCFVSKKYIFSNLVWLQMLDVVLWKVHHSLSSQFYAKHNKKCYLNFWHKSNNNLGTEFACYKSWSTLNLCKIMASSSNMILWKKSSCSWRFDYIFLYKISVLEKALKTEDSLHYRFLDFEFYCLELRGYVFSSQVCKDEYVL